MGKSEKKNHTSGSKRSKHRYSGKSMYEAVSASAKKHPKLTACDYMGTHISYRELMQNIDLCARALKACGIEQGDRVTVCMPNTPQAVIMLYAVNKMGAVANMIHPKSAEMETEFYLRDSCSTAFLTLDELHPIYAKVCENCVSLKLIIAASISDMIGVAGRLKYKLTEGRYKEKVSFGDKLLSWKEFMQKGEEYDSDCSVKVKGDDTAVILYSGGTTGQIKGIALSNRSFNALAYQFMEVNPEFEEGNKMLSAMRMSHGYGLGIGIHSVLAAGGRCVVVATYDLEGYADMLKKHKPNYIAAVPSLLDGLLRLPALDSVSLKFIKGVFCSGDKLTVELKKRFDFFLSEHGSSVTVREGYGTTECITISCLAPKEGQREGSIGLPLPDMHYSIVKTGTMDECGYGEFGEICISGPTVMSCYVNNPTETADILRTHPDGRVWLHTGDLGKMDSDGYIYFAQRIKRVIITNGYNVYPSQVEGALNKCRYVELSCVIGVADSKAGQIVKAFVKLKKNYEKSDETKERIIAICRQSITDYAIPKEIEFVDDFPKTFTGRIAYKELMRLEAQKAEEV